MHIRKKPVAVRLTCSLMIIVPFVVVGFLFGGEIQSARNDAAIRRWLGEGEASISRVAAPEALALWGRAIAMHARLGGSREALTAVSKIPQKADRAEALVRAAKWLAVTDQRAPALKLAESLEDSTHRDDVLDLVSSSAASVHDFRVAEALIAQIHDKVHRGGPLVALAFHEAKAGNPEAATRNLERGIACGAFDPVQERWLRDALRDCIQEAPRRKWHARRPLCLRESINDLSGDSVLSDESKQELVRGASDPRTPVEGRILEHCSLIDFELREGNVKVSRQRAWEAAALIEKMASSDLRVERAGRVCICLLEVGDTSKARALASVMLSVEAHRALPAETSPCTLWRSISVFMRLGESATALAIARTAKGDRKCMTWWSLGATCALEGKDAEAPELLSHIESDMDRAFFCIGVAEGLSERGGGEK